MKAFKRLPSKYSVGNDKIDLQHAQIIALLDEVLDVIKEGGTKEAYKEERIVEIIRDLNSYITNHLNYEERLMDKAKYPYIAAHLDLHSTFRKKLKEIAISKKPTNAVLHDIAKFLRDWFVNHIGEIDLQYAKYLKKKD